jgi:predicted Holliday junction resolvase-like endonuclease
MSDRGLHWPEEQAHKPSKYKSRATGGYASVKEARRAQELKLLEKAEKIHHLREQRRFELIPKQAGERPVYYFADFTYHDQDGKFVVEDVKGVKTKDYVIKRKLMLWVHGIVVREV